MSKKIITLLLILTMIFTASVTYATEDTHTSYVYDIESRPVLNDLLQSTEYEILTFRVTDVIFNSQTNIVTFKNDQKRKDGTPDTNTYIITKDTSFGKYANGEYSVDINALISGDENWVELVLKKEIKQQILAGMNDIEIYVDGVWSTYSDNPVIDSEKEELPEISSDSSTGEFTKVLKYKIMQGDENGNLNLTTPVTRAEMAQLVTNTLLLNGVTGKFSEGEEFIDLPYTHWAYNAVAHAKSNGIVNGMGDGTFAPNHSVTNAQAIKMIVAMLGYSVKAESLGGYTHGYMNIAKNLGITQGLTLDNDTPALRKDIAIILERALDIPLMRQVAFGSIPKFEIFDGTNGNELITLETELVNAFFTES